MESKQYWRKNGKCVFGIYKYQQSNKTDLHCFRKYKECHKHQKQSIHETSHDFCPHITEEE